MSRSKNQNNALLDAIIDGLQEKKAKNITVMDLTGLTNPVTDYFVIADAESRTHVDAIADSVEDVVQKKTGEKPYHSEGHQVGEWILVDYINIVVHVFQKEIRDFYNIEALWADAEVTTID
ncbi:MAG: ribosome silencing factor [Bacteroidota bacterium]|nr:ribosome silencing factor [Bacteroidota bacterium]